MQSGRIVDSDGCGLLRMIYLHDINPVAVPLGPITVHWYGLMYLAGFAVAWWLGHRRIRAGRLPRIDPQAFSDLLFNAMLGVVIGGRLGYMVFYAFDDWLTHPLLILQVWQGGMSFHGGLLGVLIASGWWTYRHRVAFADVVDFIAPLVPPGLGFGRIGNFIGGELWGRFTHHHWGVIFPRAPELEMVPMDQIRIAYSHGILDRFARHPSQLYEALLEGGVLFAVLWLASIQPQPRYRISGLFAMLYGVFRFLVEFVRVPDQGIYVAFGWLTKGQLLSIPLIIVGCVLLFLSRRSPTCVPDRPLETLS